MVLKEPQKETSQLWVEKYRPRAVSEVAHQGEVVATLQKAVHESAGRGDLPHLLFYGPPGTGKTSTALALCRDLFGPHNYRSRVLELNASDERGIKVVRDKIKTFAQTTVSSIISTKGPDGRLYPCPPFKIIVLDEADAITSDAQTALRRTMETHSKVTRFIIICNYISKIIDPLTSRCAKFRFNPLPMNVMVEHLQKISDSENVRVDKQTLQALISSSDGDLRKGINTLQSAHRMQPSEKSINIDIIAAAACLIPPDVIESFDIETSKSGVTNKDVRNVVMELLADGYSALQLLSQYTDRLISGDTRQGAASLSDAQKASICIIVAEAERALIEGSDEQLQLFNVASRISKIAECGDDVHAVLAA